MMSSVSGNLKRVRERISEAAVKSGRNPGDVRLVAVSKNFGANKVIEAVRAGQKLFGENRVQEAREKIPAANGDAEWHMIGRLQKNKAKYIPGLFTMVQSVDSFELAEALNTAMARAVEKGSQLHSGILDVLIQVNVALEESKGGVSTFETESLVKAVSKLPYLRIKGLMTIPPYSEVPEESRIYFRRLRELRDLILLENIPDIEMYELSMGMSNDFQIAIEEGATMVRVGSAIFGERSYD